MENRLLATYVIFYTGTSTEGNLERCMVTTDYFSQIFIVVCRYHNTYWEAIVTVAI